ncbi:MAG: hypothetical protein JW910_04835 [Anaerolineae bacterium]|nr:hypothetical protein [Anaerolineae bacterium]
MTLYRSHHTRSLWVAIPLVLMLALAACGSDDGTTDTPLAPDNTDVPTPVATTMHGTDEPARVLVLHSYDSGYLWEQELNQGILAGLNEGGYSNGIGNLVMDYFWMDTKRNTSPEYFSQIAEAATQRILDTRPDVVIATDNNAIRLVLQPWTEEGIPFVYAGLNDAPRNYELEDRPNVTGVLERAHIAQTLDWIKLVLPEAKRLTFLADDSITTAAYLTEVQMQLAGSTDFTVVGIYKTNSNTEWQRIVEEAQQTSDVLLLGTYTTLRDNNDRPISSTVLMGWTINHSSIPIVPLWEFGVQEGGLGGPVISGYTQGYEAALKAVQILNGTPAGDIPVSAPQRGKLTLNMVAARRWNVEFPLDLLEVSTVYDQGTVIQR